MTPTGFRNSYTNSSLMRLYFIIDSSSMTMIDAMVHAFIDINLIVFQLGKSLLKRVNVCFSEK